MNKPTLLFVEEVKNTLSKRVLSNSSINLVLLRFKQNMLFDKEHLIATSHTPSFILDKDRPVADEAQRFTDFCEKNKLKIDYFYNDSEYNQETVQRFASLLKLSGALNENQALCVRDKAIMKNKLKEIGFRTMQYQELSSIDDVVEFADKQGGFPVIVKWRKGLSSKEVYKIGSANELRHLGLDYSTRRFIVEAYCPHLIWCVDSLVQDGKIVATFLAWLPYTNLSFADKKEKFAQITVGYQPKEIKFNGGEITQNIVRELGLKNGYIHLEAFVDNAGQPIICEFAWRTPGEHMLLNHSIAFNIDVYSLLTDIIVGRKIVPQNLKESDSVGDMFLPIVNGTVSKITSYDELKDLEGVIAGEVYYKVGDCVESKRQYTSCSGWLQIRGRTKEEVISRMIKVYKKFEIEVK